MRWEALFADMEMQVEAAEALDRHAGVAEATRAERAAVLLVDRLLAAVGSTVAVTFRSGLTMRGAVVDCGHAWVLLDGGLQEHLIPVTAVGSVAGLPSSAAASGGEVARRLGLGPALRAVARDRSLVRAVTAGRVLHGRVDAVGADHLDLGLAFEDDGRPTGERHLVTFAALEVLSTV